MMIVNHAYVLETNYNDAEHEDGKDTTDNHPRYLAWDPLTEVKCLKKNKNVFDVDSKLLQSFSPLSLCRQW